MTVGFVGPSMSTVSECHSIQADMPLGRHWYLQHNRHLLQNHAIVLMLQPNTCKPGTCCNPALASPTTMFERQCCG
jgi:hypothetical protein